jgi:hypothetical protein
MTRRIHPASLPFALPDSQFRDALPSPGSYSPGEDGMADVDTPSSSKKPKGSLWTTPAARSTSLKGFHKPLVDRKVTAEQVREAVNATKERAAAFTGRVSEDLLRTSVE